MTESFPRQQARTRHFTLGLPRSFQVSPSGGQVAFLRSRGGDDPETCLWVLDVGTGQERLVADPEVLGASLAGETEQEKARRERVREQALGIVSFACDAAQRLAAFTLAGQVWVADLAEGAAPPRAVPARPGAFDPRPDPAGQRVAYVSDGTVRVVTLDTGADALLIGPEDEPGVMFGLAEFVAAEEMGRTRGYWWAPDGSAILVARVDETPVQRWHIADPANPGRAPREVGYPAAGTANADVSLMLAGLDGTTVPVGWDRAAFPYLVAVNWDGTDPLIVVQARDQRRMRLLSADPARAVTAVLREDTDDHWVDIVAGVPGWTGDGRIVWTADAGGAKRLFVAAPGELADGTAAPVTPVDLQVRGVA
ncbi:MAG TPA: DPP IV N-terminal domain-containing protein, partial [Streptosporangiaceae bacterium]|nr:DPP IV N-terminal domain-containing protein [Streptosporangiaceae bacterium]